VDALRRTLRRSGKTPTILEMTDHVSFLLVVTVIGRFMCPAGPFRPWEKTELWQLQSAIHHTIVAIII
jgi:hypothetical protein